jgi:hypothetical protein
MDLNNWIRKDGEYKGFAIPGSDTSLPIWAIVKDDTTTLRDWADNDTAMDKIWDDRVKYFTAPTVAPTFVNSSVTYNTAQVVWDYEAGMTKYFVTVYDQNDREVLPWNYNRVYITPNNQIIVRIEHLAEGTTYRAVITGFNGKGTITDEVTLTTNY